MYKIGIEMGGTFTDIYIVDEKGQPTTAKVSTNHDNLENTFTEALMKGAEIQGISVEDFMQNCDLVVNGTTVATNAVIERKGSKVGLITTKGFKDIIFIGRVMQKSAGLTQDELRDYFNLTKAVPIVPRHCVEEVGERIDYKGKVLCPLNLDDVRRAVEKLADKGVEAIGVCLFLSFKNAVHEQEIRRVINEMYPLMPVCISSEISGRVGEYERIATTAINTYVMPVVRSYLEGVDKGLKSKGYQYDPLIMQSLGGAGLPNIIKSRPISCISSGPAAGIIGTRFLGEHLGFDNIIATDVGGTSFDVGVIYRGEPIIAYEPVISKYALQLSMIDVQNVGAGGGSIAWIDELGVLKVGPQSAGSKPGPVCYDMGGNEPTVTDADLVLGYLNPDYFAGGAIRLNKDKAFSAIEVLAKKISRGVEETAKGICDIVNVQCADLVRRLTVERGYDPRDFVLFAYGGAGPTHAAWYGRALSPKKLIIPNASGVFSAFGLTSSDILGTYEISDPKVLPLEIDQAKNNFGKLESKAHMDFEQGGVKKEDRLIKRAVSMKFSRMFKELYVPIESLTVEEVAGLEKKFVDTYETIYGKGSAHMDAPVEVTAYKIEMIGKINRPFLKKHTLGKPDPSSALKMTREAFFDNSFIDTRVYEMSELKAGMVIEGPAIIEDRLTTCVIIPGQVGKVDEYLNIQIELT